METNIVNPMHAKQRSKKQELISIHSTNSSTDDINKNKNDPSLNKKENTNTNNININKDENKNGLSNNRNIRNRRRSSIKKKRWILFYILRNWVLLLFTFISIVRLCRCCCTDILSDEEEEKEKQVHVKNERGVKKTKMLKSVNSWITLPIVESK